MNFFEAITLGIIQGVTEFLPISSSGHLILAREFLGLQIDQGLAVDAVLQLVTAFAVVLYFRRDFTVLAVDALQALRGKVMSQASRTLLIALAIGTIPAVVVGLFLEDAMESAFRDPRLVAWVLIAGSGLFLLAEWVHARRTRVLPLPLTNDGSVPDAFVPLPLTNDGSVPDAFVPLPLTKGEDGRGSRGDSITTANAFLIGCFQALALIPGMSRSGATISGGMLLGLSREHAARFAFLLMVPVVVGAGSKKLLELGGAGMAESEWLMIGVASVAAFASGILSIHYLLRYLRSHSLVIFVAYRVALAIVVLSFL